jgi:hypothetical protein
MILGGVSPPNERRYMRYEKSASVARRSASHVGFKAIGLELTEKADMGYSETSPLDVIRNIDGSYRVVGAIEADNLTAEDVSDLLESLVDCWDDEDCEVNPY